MLVWAHEGISEAARGILEAASHLVLTHDACMDGKLHVLWTRDMCERDIWWPEKELLPIIACPATGTEHLDDARKRGIRVLSLRDCPAEELQSVRATVEMTIGLILSLTRRIPSAVESVRRGEWDRMKCQGTDLAGKTVLVIGFGRIGVKVHWILENAFCMNAFAWDTQLRQPGTMHDLLPTADLVTVHADLNDTSRGMFGKGQFESMKPGAFFVNTARGALVDEWALLDALKSGHLAGAALDVLRNEPPDEFGPNPLVEFARQHPERLLLTPHLGGCSVESLEKAETLLAHRLVEELANES